MSVLEDLSILGASFLLLLVSVRSASEASAAIAGGAHVIDAKDPSEGPLGAVTIDQLREIQGAIAGRRPLVRRSVTSAVPPGSSVKRGRMRVPVPSSSRLVSPVSLAPRRSLHLCACRRSRCKARKRWQGWCRRRHLRGRTQPGDADGHRLLDAAANAGAAGLLVDTWNKDGAGPQPPAL